MCYWLVIIKCQSVTFVICSVQWAHAGLWIKLIYWMQPLVNILSIANHKLTKFVVHAIQYTRHVYYNPISCKHTIVIYYCLRIAVMLLTSFSPPPGKGRTMMIPPRKWLACTLSARSPSIRSHRYRIPGPAPDMVVPVGCDAVQRWGYEIRGAQSNRIGMASYLR